MEKEALSPKQEVFVRNYIETWNASVAAQRAGYSKPYNVSGAKVLHSPIVQAAVAPHLRDAGLTRDFIMQYLAEIARSSIEDFVEVNKKTGLTKFNLKKAMDQGSLRFVKRIRLRKGEVESIELLDVHRALEVLAKLLGLFDENAKPEEQNEVLEWLKRLASGESK